MRLSDFDFTLPDERIALHPASPRDSARLLVVRPGGTPACADHVFTDLPALLNPGDLLVFKTAGAYGASMSSTYNQRPLVPEVLVKDNAYAVTRPRQTYEELIGTDRAPGWF